MFPVVLFIVADTRGMRVGQTGSLLWVQQTRACGTQGWTVGGRALDLGGDSQLGAAGLFWSIFPL